MDFDEPFLETLAWVRIPGDQDAGIADIHLTITNLDGIEFDVPEERERVRQELTDCFEEIYGVGRVTVKFNFEAMTKNV